MQSLNRAAGLLSAATPSSSRARLWAPLATRRPSVAVAAAGGGGGDDQEGGTAAAAPSQPLVDQSSSKPPPRPRLSPGDRRRAQRAAVAARIAERRRALGGRGRGALIVDDDGDDDADGDAANAARRRRANNTDKPRTSAEARARLAEHVDPAALAALDQLEGAVGRLPPLQAAALLTMARGEMSARFDAALASVEADGAGQLAGLFAAAAAAGRAESGGGGSGDDESIDGGPDSVERAKNAMVADEALDRAIWELCLRRALTEPQRAVLEKIVVGVPLRRAPQALARALAAGLDPSNRPSATGGEDDGDEEEEDDGAFAIARRLEGLTEAEGVHLRRAAAALAATLASLRGAAFAVGGAEEARRTFEASLAGMVAGGASSAAEEDGEEEEDEDDNGAAAAAEQEAAAAAAAETPDQQEEEEEEDLDPLQRRLRAYAKYARVLAESPPQQARALWYAAGGEPSDAFRALKDVVRRIVEVSLVVPQLARHEEGRAEAAARAWQEAHEKFVKEEGGGGENDAEAGGDNGAAEDAADRAARSAADAYDAAHPEGAELSRAAEKLRAARRALQRRAVGGGREEGEEGEDDEDNDADDAAEDNNDDDEDEASAAAYRQLLAPLTDDEAAAAFVSLSDELGAILASIQNASGEGSRPKGEREEEEEGEGNNSNSNKSPRPTAAGRWASRRAAGADARSAALYLAALTDDDGAFDASPANLARLCTFLRAAEALEALKALAAHSREARTPADLLSYGTDRGTARGRRAAAAAAEAFSERERSPFSLSSAKSGAPKSSPRAASLGPPTGAEAVRLAGLDRDDWWVPQEKRGRAWAAVRVAELDASFAGKAAAAAARPSGGSRRRGGSNKSGGRGFGFGGSRDAGTAGGGEEAAGEGEGGSGAASAAFAGENPYRALLRFADEERIRELAALDADDLLFLADMERCGWGDDDCLVKWTLHPRVGPRLRATAPGGAGYGGGAGASSSPSSSLEGSARGGAGAFFGGLPDSLRELMSEARAAAAAERAQAGGG